MDEATRIHKPKTKAELLSLVDLLKVDRPQIFHGTKGKPGSTATIYTPIKNEQD